MFMKQISLFIALILLSACTGGSEKIYLRTEKGPRETPVIPAANTLLTMEVKGMTCEMGCGGSIRKAVKGTGAVARVRYEWVEGKKVQKAFVSFDSTKVSVKELVAIVNELNEGQFTVGKHFSSPIEVTNTQTEKPAPEDSESAIEINNTHFEFPNLLNILKDLIVG
jgi:copper chaperone CopZ